MSSDRVPSRSEVSGWSPQQLADYLKRMSLSGCDKVVLKNSISGSRFVNLSENDLQKFPKLHAPMVSKLSSEISKKEERRGLFSKKATPKYHEPDVAADQGWGEDEFDDEEFDEDYESPYSADEDGSGGDYESPNDDVANDYEPPPSEPPDDLPHKLCPTLPLGDGNYIDNVPRGPPPAVCPRPPVSGLAPPPLRTDPPTPRRDHSPHPAGRPAERLPPEPPRINRGNKPGRESGASPSPIRAGPQRGAAEKPAAWRSQPDAPDPPAWSRPPSLPPSSTSVSRSNSSARPPAQHNTFPLQNKSLPPRPGLPVPASHLGDSVPPHVPAGGSLPHRLQSAMAERGSRPDRPSIRPPPSTAAHTQDLDPRWYVGKVTRGQAEGSLKQVHKDGAYLVRDSNRQLANQPFTLMVLFQEKVFNIQIRRQNQQYQLGTGLKAQESFSSVSDIISHYSQSPLFLIDAKNRGTGQHNQCLLSEPAGFCLTGQTWS